MIYHVQDKLPYGTPRIIIHGGAGNINTDNLPPAREKAYRNSLHSYLREGQRLLDEGHDAVDVATAVVTLFEDDELFNAGRGAVFTRAGTIELEASIMVSRGYRKRGVGCMCVTRVRNPIKLAREMLVRGDDADGKGGGAYAHSQLSGEELENLAMEWGLDMVEPHYFWTQRRWDEHKRGLEEGHSQGQTKLAELIDYDSPPAVAVVKEDHKVHEALSQGTVGAVILDRYGTLCVATSTGGLTNKLPGRIGDTPTLGAGFWAEEWEEAVQEADGVGLSSTLQSLGCSPVLRIADFFRGCLPIGTTSGRDRWSMKWMAQTPKKYAIAMSGTGNGDSFLRVNAVRTAGAMVRFSHPLQKVSLARAITKVAGPGGELQQSADDRWGNGEGEGGIIGIEICNGSSTIAWDFNCGGLFRAWIDDDGVERCMIFADH